jgi:hypothetical protein
MRKERVADSEGTGRLANEVLNRSAPESWGRDGQATFRCECGDDVCSDPLTIPRELYERIRGDSMLFLIRPGHEVPEAEDVIEKGEGYWIVRKHEDVRPIVERSDPRT